VAQCDWLEYLSTYALQLFDYTETYSIGMFWLKVQKLAKNKIKGTKALEQNIEVISES